MSEVLTPDHNAAYKIGQNVLTRGRLIYVTQTERGVLVLIEWHMRGTSNTWRTFENISDVIFLQPAHGDPQDAAAVDPTASLQ